MLRFSPELYVPGSCEFPTSVLALPYGIKNRDQTQERGLDCCGIEQSICSAEECDF